MEAQLVDQEMEKNFEIAKLLMAEKETNEKYRDIQAELILVREEQTMLNDIVREANKQL